MAEVRLTVLGEDKSAPAITAVKNTEAAAGALESVIRELSSAVTALGGNIAQNTRGMEANFSGLSSAVAALEGRVAKSTAEMEADFAGTKESVGKSMKAAVDAAESEMSRLNATGKGVSDRLSNHFEALGVRSSLAIEQERDRAVKAFGMIRDSGVASADEVGRAEKALQQKLGELNEELNGKTVPSTNNWASALGVVKGALAALGVTWLAAKIKEGVEDVALMAARYQTLGVTMHVVGNNAGYSGQQMDAFEAKLRKTGIAAVESRQNLTTMSQAHIDLAKSTELAREAQDAAVIGNINSSEAFSRMIYGIQSGQVEVLRTIGINVNFEDSYKKLGRQLGKSAEDLNEYEKTQARTNAVLAKGKDIAGAYEASMGTAGKQITSMKRYVDDLKVTVGAVFNDALLIGVQAVTGGLKDLNDEAGQLRQRGDLEKWGKDVVMTLAFVADAASFPIKAISTLSASVADSVSRALSMGVIVSRALKGDFAGAYDEWQILKASFGAFREDVGKMWTSSSFQQDAQKFYAEREANAAKDKALSDEAEKRRMAAGDATRKEAEARAAAEKAEKSYLENVKNGIDGVKNYTGAVKELGKERLTFASESYNDKLKRTVELYKEGRAAVESLIAPLKRYNVEVNDTFNRRVSEEGAALGKLEALYKEFKNQISLNALSKEARTAGVEILKSYRETAQGIISTEKDRYKTLLEGERAYANQVLDLIKAKKEEIKELQYRFTDANKVFEEQKRTALQGKYVQGDYKYLDASLDPYQKRMAQIEKLNREKASALEIPDTARRNAKLQEVADGWGKLTDAVTITRTETERYFTDDGSWGGKVAERVVAVTDTIITQEEAYNTATAERKRIQEEMIGLVQSEQDKLQTAYEKTLAKMEVYKDKLEDLDDIISDLTTTVTIDLKVNGLEQIGQIQNFVSQATSSPYVNVTSTVLNAGWWDNGIEHRASGGPVRPGATYRVNEDGTEYLTMGSQGGWITPAGKGPNQAQAAGTVVNIPGGLQVIVQGAGKDADQLADELGRKLWAKFQEWGTRKRA